MTEAFKHFVAKEIESYRCEDKTRVRRLEEISTNDIYLAFVSLLSGNGQNMNHLSHA